MGKQRQASDGFWNIVVSRTWASRKAL